MDVSGPEHINLKLLWSQFESLINPLVQRSIDLRKEALSGAGSKSNDIKEVIFVGGTTCMLKVVETIKNIFGRGPNESTNPGETVVAGAAIQGAVMSGSIGDILSLGVTLYPSVSRQLF